MTCRISGFLGAVVCSLSGFEPLRVTSDFVFVCLFVCLFVCFLQHISI